MAVRIAIPVPHSSDSNYSERAIPQYERAIGVVGAESVRIPLDQSPAQLKTLIETCDAVLLPGSTADVDPAKFGQKKSNRSAKPDPRRELVDSILLDDAYARRKPVLCICYGLQSLNVYRQGSLVQHIPDFLPRATRKKVNHAIGGKVGIAHTVEIQPGSRLAEIVNRGGHGPGEQTEGKNLDSPSQASALIVPVNSSHHQSADSIGQGLRVIARCPDDGIIEALEGTSSDHFVLAVQWHPERSVEDDPASRAIFRALVEATR